MPSLSARASADLKRIIENENGAGMRYTLIDKGGKEYPLIGTFGDIASLTDPITGETIQDREIEVTCMAQTILAAAGKIPVRGWKARVTGLDGKEIILFVRRNDYDRTIGLCHLLLGL
jgi:nitrogen fixation protein FixH